MSAATIQISSNFSKEYGVTRPNVLVEAYWGFERKTITRMRVGDYIQKLYYQRCGRDGDS